MRTIALEPMRNVVEAPDDATQLEREGEDGVVLAETRVRHDHVQRPRHVVRQLEAVQRAHVCKQNTARSRQASCRTSQVRSNRQTQHAS